MTPVLAQARLDGDEVILSWPGHDEFTKHIPTAGGGTADGASDVTPDRPTDRPIDGASGGPADGASGEASGGTSGREGGSI